MYSHFLRLLAQGYNVKIELCHITKAIGCFGNWAAINRICKGNAVEEVVDIQALVNESVTSLLGSGALQD